MQYAVWADKITTKESTGKSPFEFVYGLNVTLPINLKLPVYKILQQNVDDLDIYQRRINSLIELDENRRKTFVGRPLIT